MNSYFEKVKGHLLELGHNITFEDPQQGIFMIDEENSGIKNLMIGCAEPILIMEQYLLDLQHDSSEVLKKLLQKNRDIIHGAFVLDETGKKLLFRDTLQLETLDLNELEESINSLSLLLSEYYEDLITFSKN